LYFEGHEGHGVQVPEELGSEGFVVKIRRGLVALTEKGYKAIKKLVKR